MIKLYTYPASSNSRKVRVVLLEKGLEFERVTIDLSKREQKSPEYLKIHPFGTVPALDDEGFVVYDSTMINEYLEDEYPYPPLMPKDSEGARGHDSWRTCGIATSTLLVDNSIASSVNPKRKEIRRSLSKRGPRLPNALTDLKKNLKAANIWLAHSALATSPLFRISTPSIEYRSKSIRNTRISTPGSPA